MTKKHKKGRLTKETDGEGEQVKPENVNNTSPEILTERNTRLADLEQERRTVIQDVCAVCKKPGDKSCGSCRSVHYCSVEHQREHWKIHKNVCPPYMVDWNEELGNQWLASRNLKAGSIVIDDPPSLFGPQWTESQIHENGVPNCLTCGVYMQQDKTRRCQSCQWPICSDKCSQHPIHSLYECQTFSQKKIPFPPPNFPYSPADLCLCITWLRGAGLKSHDEQKYKEVMTLQHYFVDPLYNQALDEASEEVISKLKSLVGSELDGHEEDYKRIARAKKVNAYAGNLYPNIINTYQNDFAPSSGLYVSASKANHSCVPNMSWSLGGLLPPDLRLRFRAALDIKKGEPLTVSYRPSDIQLGTTERQVALRNGYGFICKCPRCTDPTECGTFVSAITCQECLGKTKDSNLGYFLPEDPLNLDKDALWRCNHCKGTKQNQELQSIVSSLEERVEYQKIVFGKKLVDGKTVGEFYEKFLHDNKNKLHPNHWIFQKVTMEIIVCHRTMKNAMSRGELERSIGYFEYRLGIQDKTTPGVSAERALTFRYLKDVLLTLLARFNSTMSPNEIRHWAGYCRKVLTDALEYYRNDINPQNTMQKPMAITEMLQQDLENLEKNVKKSLILMSTLKAGRK